jgi:hypothetical protein
LDFAKTKSVGAIFAPQRRIYTDQLDFVYDERKAHIVAIGTMAESLYTYAGMAVIERE